MSSTAIRNLGQSVEDRLRVRAAEHEQSMEEEARRILQTALEGTVNMLERTFYDRIHARFASIGGVALELSPRGIVMPHRR